VTVLTTALSALDCASFAQRLARSATPKRIYRPTHTFLSYRERVDTSCDEAPPSMQMKIGRSEGLYPRIQSAAKHNRTFLARACCAIVSMCEMRICWGLRMDALSQFLRLSVILIAMGVVVWLFV